MFAVEQGTTMTQAFGISIVLFVPVIIGKSKHDQLTGSTHRIASHLEYSLKSMHLKAKHNLRLIFLRLRNAKILINIYIYFFITFPSYKH